MGQSVEAATITGHEDSSFPHQNLQDRNKNSLWKADSAALARQIDMDFGLTSDYTVDTLIIGNHNLDIYGIGKGIKLQSADDSGFANTPIYHVGSANAYHDYVSGDLTNWYETFSSQTDRYWRITIEANPPPNGPQSPQCGTIFLGIKRTPSLSYDVGDKEKSDYPEIDISKSIGGMKYSYARNDNIRRKYNISFRHGESDKTIFKNFVDDIDGWRHPFFYSPDDGTTWIYSRLRDTGIEFTRVTHEWYNGTVIPIEEEL